MITKFSLQHFKAFSSFEMESIPRFLVIGGKNNSSKTSFLEAMFLGLDLVNPQMFLRHLNWRGLNNISNNAETLFAPAFHNLDLSKPIVLEYDLGNSVRKIQYEFISGPTITKSFVTEGGQSLDLVKNAFPVSGFGIKITFWPNVKAKAEKKFEAFLNSDAMSQISLMSQGQAALQELVRYAQGFRAVFLSSTNVVPAEENANRFSALEIEGKTQDVLTALKIIEPNLKSLNVVSLSGRPAIYGDIGIGRKVPISLMGQGVDRLLSIILAISEAKNGVVFVDEIENGFHWSTLASVSETLANHSKTNNTQIVATTHSREFLMGMAEGLPQEQRNDFRYIRFEKTVGDGIKKKIYNLETLSSALEAELEIR